MEKISKKSKLVVQITALLLLLCLSVIACQFNLEVKADTAGVQNTSFSIIQITDTQHLADMYPQQFDNLTNWIVANAVNYNVSMVIHTGDNVDYASSPYDWQNANRSMSTLLNNGIPYCWTAGNHDQFPQQNPNTNWLGSGYAAFNPAVMRAKPYWVSDLFNGKETAVQFSYGNYKFLVIDMEFYANSTAISWMTNLITTHPDYNVIVGVHCLLNSTGGYMNNGGNGAWEKNFANTLNNYPNVFLTLNGHDHGSNFASRNQVGNRTQIYWDMQEIMNQTGAHVGAASARIYSFDMNSKLISTSTYLVYNSTLLTDSQNSFIFPPILIKSNPDPTINPTPTPTPTSTPVPTPTQTPILSLEPTPIDNPTPMDSTPLMPSEISSPNQASYSSPPISSRYSKPIPTATPFQQTPSPTPTEQANAQYTNSNSKSNPTAPPTSATAINKAALFPLSGIPLQPVHLYFSPIALIVIFVAAVIREKTSKYNDWIRENENENKKRPELS